MSDPGLQTTKPANEVGYQRVIKIINKAKRKAAKNSKEKKSLLILVYAFYFHAKRLL